LAKRFIDDLLGLVGGEGRPAVADAGEAGPMLACLRYARPFAVEHAVHQGESA